MKVGVFDSGLGGLTVVSSIFEVFDSLDVFYLADTMFSPYGLKNDEELLKRSIQISEYLIKNYQIEALVLACNTATSVAVEHLRQKYPFLIVVGTEPGLKPALSMTKTNNIAVWATSATLRGVKYKNLLTYLLKDKKVKVFENPCIGLVEQIEEGKTEDEKTFLMMKKWLEPMKKNKVDTIVLGCTHYPLISHIIKKIMGNDIQIVTTGKAIAKRLKNLSAKKSTNKNKNLYIYHTKKINESMIETIFKDIDINKKTIRKCEI